MSRYPTLSYATHNREDIESYSQLATAPGPFLEFGEFLYLEATSTDASATLRFSGKFLSTDGEIRSFSEDMTITGTGNQTAVTSRIGPCWLMGFAVRVVTGTITDGEVVASVHVARASASTPVHVMTLASGEVTNTRALGLGAYLSGYASVSLINIAATVVTVADPAAGANWTATVPASTEYEVINIYARLVTSATVADRYPEMRVLASAVPLSVAAGTTPQTAGKTIDYNWNPDQNMLGKFGYDGSVEIVPFAPRYVPAGAVIGPRVFGIDATDQWSNIRLTVKSRTS